MKALNTELQIRDLSAAMYMCMRMCTPRMGEVDGTAHMGMMCG